MRLPHIGWLLPGSSIQVPGVPSCRHRRRAFSRDTRKRRPCEAPSKRRVRRVRDAAACRAALLAVSLDFGGGQRPRRSGCPHALTYSRRQTGKSVAADPNGMSPSALCPERSEVFRGPARMQRRLRLGIGSVRLFDW
eukprot:350984-Chlamydomonas_euryale.AAC.4